MGGTLGTLSRNMFEQATLFRHRKVALNEKVN